MMIVIFGGEDHEEQAARKVCKSLGVVTATATIGGKPCHAGNAYDADGNDLEPTAMPHEVVLFECGDGAANGHGLTTHWGNDDTPPGAVYPKTFPVVAKCDHHRPGDYGYGMGPEKFWEASSIGQLCALLGVPPTEELLMVAAGDHCPAAAYRGLCPGIDAQQFKTHRIKQMEVITECPGIDIDGNLGATGFHSNLPEVEKAINFATALLLVAPDSQFEGVKDLRQYGRVDQLPEAALIAGLAYLSQIPDTDREGNPTGKVKVNLGGDNSPETVASVMEWLNTLPSGDAPAYGVPSRGFAGRVFTRVWMPA